jgi:hypothetical protein
MPIIASDSGNGTYTLCPAGTHGSRCVDIVDLGVVTSEFAGEKKEQHKVNIIWQTGEINEKTGKPFLARKRYTLSLHEKSTLRKDLESWRGQAFTPAEAKGFDLERLIGIPALINVLHEHKNGKDYDNVTTLMKLPKGMSAPDADPGYVRVCNRKDKSQSEPVPHDPETDAPTDDYVESVPF